MLKRTLYAFVAVSALAAPAFAQTAPSTNTTAPGTTTTSSTDQFVAKASPGEWRASKLSGVAIYGPNNESVGKVSDVVVDKTGSAKVIVISVGGVMGVGSKNVAVPFSAVTWSDHPKETTASTSNSSATRAPSAPLAPPAGGTSSSTTSSNTAAATPAVLDYPDHGMINMTTEQLKAAPDFKYASEKAS